MKAALISLGSKSSTWTAEAMRKYFDEVDEINLKELEVNLSQQRSILHNGKPLKKYDCVLVKGSFRYVELMKSISSIIEGSCYVPIQSDAFTMSHDKLLTQIQLTKHNIPMPATYIASSAEGAKTVLEKMNYPVIMKLPKGTQGKGVMFADSFASASSMLDALEALRQPFLIQEYIETGGTDTRVFVIGDKVVASMQRKSKGEDKRSNIHAGGVGEVCMIDTKTRKVAINAAKAIGAEICGVDILQGLSGPMVLEINISPGLQGITQATDIDVADKIASYLFSQTEAWNESRSEKTESVLEELGIQEKKGPEQGIITGIEMRGERILLPKQVTKITGFDDDDEVLLTAEKGILTLKKM